MAGLCDAIREAIRRSGLSQAEICKQAGIRPPVLSRFMQGGDAKASTLDRVASVIDISVVGAAERRRWMEMEDAVLETIRRMGLHKG